MFLHVLTKCDSLPKIQLRVKTVNSTRVFSLKCRPIGA